MTQPEDPDQSESTTPGSGDAEDAAKATRAGSSGTVAARRTGESRATPVTRSPRTDPGLEELRARGLMVRLPMPTTAAPRPEAAAARRAPAPPTPVSGPINRAEPLDAFMRTTPVVQDDRLLFVVQRPYSYPSGPLPGDPAQAPPFVDSRAAVCHVLSPGAALRCLRQRGSF